MDQVFIRRYFLEYRQDFFHDFYDTKFYEFLQQFILWILQENFQTFFKALTVCFTKYLCFE